MQAKRFNPGPLIPIIVKIYPLPTCLLLLYCVLAQLNAMGQSYPVPDWFFETNNYNSNNKSIGISDPGLDKSLAFKQAKLRALFNYSLFHNCKSSSLTSASIGTQSNAPAQINDIGYVIYTNILKGNLPSMTNVTVADSFYNSNHEAIVLLNWDNPPPAFDSIYTFNLKRMAAYQRAGDKFPAAVDELNYEILKNDSVIEYFHIEKNGAKIKNIGNQKNKNFFDEELPRHPLYYGSIDKTLGYEPDNNMLPVALASGLWNAYLINLTDRICIGNSLDKDAQFKLSTSNLGNLDIQKNISSMNQMVFSLKNVYNSNIRIKLYNIGIRDNKLYIGLNDQVNSDMESGRAFLTGRKQKKELKKLKDENWQVYNQDEMIGAWQSSRNLMKSDQYVHAEIELEATDLQSGIIEAINLAKLEMSGLLGSNLNTVTNLVNSNEEQISLNTSKSTVLNKTTKSGPYFIFYTNNYLPAYRIKLVLFNGLN